MTRLLRCLALLLAVALSAAAVDWGALQPEGHVSDFAKVLSPKAREGLERYCVNLKQSTGAEIALVTVPTLDGEPIESVANYLFRHWGVGDKKSQEGVLVLLAIQDRRSRVEVGYGLEPTLTDGFVGSVLRSMRAPLRAGNYDLAMAEAAMTLGQKISEAKGVAVPSQLPVRRPPRDSGGDRFPSGFVVLAILLLILMSRRGRRGRGGSAWWLPLLMFPHSGGMGPRGGGAFGGYDSSDSFGGFGGGDSGGGGASSDW